MVAYNHTIKFLPELNENEEFENVSYETILVKESSLSEFDLREKLRKIGR